MIADAGYGDSTNFRLALTERDIPYVVAVKAASAHPSEAVPVAALRSRDRERHPALTLYGILREIQRAPAIWIDTCPLCHHRCPT